MTILEVLQPGPLSLIQDLGRPGWSSIGVSRSGAFDRAALALANRIVGNPENLAGIETVLGGLHLLAHAPMTVAVTGASGPVQLAPGSRRSRAHPVDRRSPLHLQGGDRIRIGNPDRGLRTYVAIRGGLEIQPVLGSASHDTLSGLGPPRVATADLLPLGPQPAGSIIVDHVPIGSAPDPTAPIQLEVVPGPHHRSLDGLLPIEALEMLQGAPYRVEPSSDRIGIRLVGPTLPRQPGELPSAPMRPGAIQVPASGQPIVLGPDAPTTGGFPVLATLTPPALDAIGQARPGDLVRLRVLRHRTMTSMQ